MLHNITVKNVSDNALSKARVAELSRNMAKLQNLTAKQLQSCMACELMLLIQYSQLYQ